MQRNKPEHPPLIAGLVACHTCGNLLKPKPILGRNGVQTIRYECHNKETMCSYRVDHLAYLTSEPEIVRPNEKDV